MAPRYFVAFLRDIPCVALLLVMIITVWRIPILYRKYKKASLTFLKRVLKFFVFFFWVGVVQQSAVWARWQWASTDCVWVWSLDFGCSVRFDGCVCCFGGTLARGWVDDSSEKSRVLQQRRRSSTSMFPILSGGDFRHAFVLVFCG